MRRPTMNNLVKKMTVATVLLTTSVTGMSFANTFQTGTLNTSVTQITNTANVEATLQIPAVYLLNNEAIKINKLNMPFASEKNNLMVPLKLFANGLNHDVKWDSTERSVTFTSEGKSTKFYYSVTPQQEFGTALKGEDGRIYDATIRLGSLYVQPNFFQEGLGCVVVTDHLNQLRIDSAKYAPDEASTLGEIISVENGKDGVQVLVKGQKYGMYGLNEVSLAVSNKVSITLSNGNALSLSDLKVGSQIYVKYGRALTKSLPAMGQAESVTVLKDENLFEGKVYWKQTEINAMNPKVKQLRVIGTADFLIGINEQTVISDGKGNLKTFDDLQEGMILKVVTAPFAAMSYPAQTGAYRIEIIK